MLPRAALLGLGLGLLSCGGAPEAPPAVPAPAASASAVAPPPAPPFDTSLPPGAAVLVSVDLGKVQSPGSVLATTHAAEVDELEGLLGVSPGALSNPGWQAALGFDVARPVTIALVGPTAEDRQALAALRALAPDQEPAGKVVPGAFEALHAAAVKLGVLLEARVVLPVTDAARVKQTIAALLEKARFAAGGPDVYTRRDFCVALGGDAGTVVVDVAVGRGAREAVAALRARAPGGPHGDPPALEGGLVRMTLTPAAIADMSFATALPKIDGAVAGGSVTPELKQKIASQGLWEAAQVYVLAGSAKGAYFDRVDLSGTFADRTEVVLRADPGPGFVPPPEDAWKPSTSIAFKGAPGSSFDVSRAFLDAWPFPGVATGGSAGAKPLHELPGAGADHAFGASRIIALVRSAGWGGYVVGIPSSPALSLSMLLSEGPAVRGLHLPLQRFERVGEWRTFGKDGPSDGFFGLLPEGTSRAKAECALAEATPCKDRLKLGAVTDRKGAFVRLAAVEKRFVVLVGRSRAAVEGDLSLRTVGPFSGSIGPMGDLIPDSGPSLLPPQGSPMIVSVERRGASIVWRLASP